MRHYHVLFAILTGGTLDYEEHVDPMFRATREHAERALQRHLIGLAREGGQAARLTGKQPDGFLNDVPAWKVELNDDGWLVMTTVTCDESCEWRTAL